MTYVGRIKGGALILDEPVGLPEDTAVVVEIVAASVEELEPEVRQWVGVLPTEIDVREIYRQHLMEKHS